MERIAADMHDSHLRISVTIAATAAIAAITSVAHAQTYTLSTIATFDGANGAEPFAGLTLDSSGNIYGTTRSGGTSDKGTVFEIAAKTGKLTTLVNFDGANGDSPIEALVLDHIGNLYGTTLGGGATGYGTVFKIALLTNRFTTLANFDGVKGEQPTSIVIDADGNLYGTTLSGGVAHHGTLYKIAVGTRDLTTIANCDRDTHAPNCLQRASNGDFYGTNLSGGANGFGAIFKVAAGANKPTVIASFNSRGFSFPDNSLLLAGDGSLYGTTRQVGLLGDVNDGMVFKVAAGTSVITILADFPLASKDYHHGKLAIDNRSNLYGATAYGSDAEEKGMVFKIVLESGVMTPIATFNGANGKTPCGGVTLGASGVLYGTTQYGGASDKGTVFKLTPSSAISP